MLVAAGILAAALASLAGLFPRAIEAGLTSRSRVHATMLAVQKIEELRGLASGDAAAGAERIGWLVGPVASATSGTFHRRWELQPTGPGVSLLRVEVRGPDTGLLAAERVTLVAILSVSP